MSRLLEGKIAIIYGGGGGLGAGVARTFAGITGTMTNVTSGLVLR